MMAYESGLRSDRRQSSAWTFRRSLPVAGRGRTKSLAQATGEDGIVDAAILPAVEGVRPLQLEGPDVVAGVVDDRNHARDSGCPRAIAAGR
jgi:hypothetical protein